MKSSAGKILTHEALDFWFPPRPKRYGQIIALTCGTFDVLHAGHVAYLEAAKDWCDLLVVAVNSDESVESYKGRPPVVPQDQRMRVLAALASVDAVTLLEQDRPLPLIERWEPALYVKGGDYTPGALRSAATVEAYGGKVLTLASEWPGVSTSGIKKRIVEVSGSL